MTNEKIEKQAREYAKIRQQSVINGKTITIVNEVKKQAFQDGAKWMQKLAIKEINELKCINKQLALRIKTLEREVK